jgi:nitronate monooxygenase
VSLNKFSPTGFYSSAVRNDFLKELEERSQRQVSFSGVPGGPYTLSWEIGGRGRVVYIRPQDRDQVQDWCDQGFSTALKTPEHTLIFVSPEKAQDIRQDQIDCMGCLSACRFSNWQQPHYASLLAARGSASGTPGGLVMDDQPASSLTTGLKPDPRSFCIQKTLQHVAHGGSTDNNLLFAGHQAYRFAQDPFYAGGFIPTVQQLVERIQTGA